MAGLSAAAAAADDAGDAPPAVHRLGWRDLPAAERHPLSLGPADRRKRFLSPADDGAIAAYVSRIDPDRAVLVGAAGPDGRVVGVAEALALAFAEGTEAAVSLSRRRTGRSPGRRGRSGRAPRAWAARSSSPKRRAR